jgi:hypothetical protein
MLSLEVGDVVVRVELAIVTSTNDLEAAWHVPLSSGGLLPG